MTHEEEHDNIWEVLDKHTEALKMVAKNQEMIFKILQKKENYDYRQN